MSEESSVTIAARSD